MNEAASSSAAAAVEAVGTAVATDNGARGRGRCRAARGAEGAEGAEHIVNINRAVAVEIGLSISTAERREHAEDVLEGCNPAAG